MESIGEKIKQLRRQKGITQSELAKKVGVSTQAVSKWESNISFPDIMLLPNIAAFFGVTVDSLFSYSVDKEYERIEHMLEYQSLTGSSDFLSAERFLLSEIEENGDNYKAIHLLADLYCFRATVMEKKASHYAKRALRLKPNEKADMSIICHVEHGKLYDWNIANHRSLIDYWYKILREEPSNVRAYFYLLDDLIDDHRLSEAKEVLKESFENNPNELNEAYEIAIDEAALGFESVADRYRALAEKYSDKWRIQFNVANSFSYGEHFEEAIGYWRRGFEVMPAPRYTDFHDAIAQCYLRLGDKKNAVKALKDKKKLLRDEWGVTYGNEVDAIDQMISELS